MTSQQSVLILCTGNSCRSQMAEGFLRHLAGNMFQVHSAGSHPAGFVHPRAIEVMKEIGIDISGHTSRHLKELLGHRIDTVITVCGKADQACPTFPGQVNRYHWGFDDPAHAQGAEDQILASFRRVRDQIRLVMTAYVAGYREGQANGSR